MAVSVSNVLSVPYRISGNQRKTVYDVTFDSSYAEGGEPLTQKELGLSKIEYAEVTFKNGTEASEKWVAAGEYTPSEEKIHLQDLKTGKELAKETNCEKVKVRVVSYGW
ncbi:MAG TPA: hypothetical protein VFT74_02770 [Isosphaeraceae bacterium]|nr:hypothetical protein [Isosphaeraceae bacterium]